ncbi:MAG: phospho-N-acetylmuramoyl-pentapeptide-transferase [Candidatus Falkowbacteria bacterium]|nr:phospho-N-acetylmuramoyl-pentapeptide-transferase [Candidatus Falkowbacteria bacterium]
MQDFEIIKVLLLTTLSFIFTIAWTPILTHFLYKYKVGKPIRDTGATPIFSKLHAGKSGTPTMGGVLVWGTVLVFSLFFFLLPKIISNDFLKSLNFLTRSETFLPLGVLVATALVGLTDDYVDLKGKSKGGLTIKRRLLVYTLIALAGASWFYYKLGWDLFHVPFVGNIELGWAYILAFVNETDGLDGLAGGTLLTSYSAYGIIAFSLGKYDLATFCGVLAGALLAFLWFNINPARFFMGDTGAMSMGITLGVMAMLTNTPLILPIIGSVFVFESVSVIIQISSKKLRNGKKVFLSAPVHHHFEAIGWSEPKIVMRFWIISAVSAGFGLALFLLDKTF